MKNNQSKIKLVIDVGNSYLKIGVFHDLELIELKKFKTKYFKISYFENFYKKVFAKYKFNLFIVFGSVVPSIEQKFLDFVKENNLENNFFLINNYLKLSFKVPQEKLGLIGNDLLGAMEYASKETSNALIFLFGTASVALLLEKLNFRGAIIAPGMNFSFNNLLSKAKKLKGFKLHKENVSLWNLNTQDALESGYENLKNGFIKQIICKSNSNYPVYISGGDISNLSPEISHQFVDNIVLKGYLLIYLKNC